MTNASNIIELNGSQYDALTGAIIAPFGSSNNSGRQADARYQPQAAPVIQPAQPQPATQVAAPAVQTTVQATPTVVAAPSSHAASHVAAVAHVPVAHPKPAHAAQATRQSASHAKRHRPHSAKTLMRHTVHAPSPSHASAHKRQAAHTTIRVQADASKLKFDVTASPAARRRQSHRPAAQVDRSQMVERFRKQPLQPSQASPVSVPVTASSAQRSVQAQQVVQASPFAEQARQLNDTRVPAVANAIAANQPDQPLAAPHQAPPVTLESQSREANERHFPSADRYQTHEYAEDSTEESFESALAAIAPATPRTTIQIASKQATPAIESASASPSNIAAPSQASSDVFERALAVAATNQKDKAAPQTQASASKLGKLKKPRKLARWAASAAVLVALIGIVAFQNRGSIQLQMASAKAGFAASSPSYKPNGFAMAKITYAPGTVATDYKHDSRSFTVIQKKSNWDSQTLLDNFVATSNEAYQGYQSNGRTIYVYGTGRATWVRDGIWYQIQADNVLSNEQLVKIAASM